MPGASEGGLALPDGASPHDAAAAEAAPPPTPPTMPEAAASESGGGALGAPDATEDTAGWTLTWSDEFNLPDGSPVDPTKWQHDTGGGGFGNNEREYYTDGTQNAVIQGGMLVITAKADGAQYNCWYGTCSYTSARLNTAGLFSQQYGRIEASIQVASEKGMWPAFWMLGNNIGNVGWPACGEIDTLETINVADSAHGSLHAQGYDATASFAPPGVTDLGKAFHTYAVEWDASHISFFVDDQLYETHTPSDAMSNGGSWPFDQPNFIILNLAIGGNWPGDPDGTTTFPAVMKVDWVRAYSKST
jgi:beta-glucanase (GH16 family)